MTYERWGIPPLYVHACIYLYKDRGSNHTCKHFYYCKEVYEEVSKVLLKIIFREVSRPISTVMALILLLLLSLFCLCIDVDASFLFKSTMVSCSHCFAIRVCSYVLMFAYFQRWASARWWDENPLKRTHWRLNSCLWGQQPSTCQI